MSAPLLQIDVLTLSRAVVSGERDLGTVTRAEVIALIGFCLRMNNEEPAHPLNADPAVAADPSLETEFQK